MRENWICAFLVLFQDIEKEVRKEVDDAIAKAKVRSIYAEISAVQGFEFSNISLIFFINFP